MELDVEKVLKTIGLHCSMGSPSMLSKSAMSHSTLYTQILLGLPSGADPRAPPSTTNLNPF